MPRRPPFARIATTLPAETLREADDLAARHDRSRSWIVAEAIRQYAASQRSGALAEDVSARLGRARAEQLRRDVGLSPESRVRASEDDAAIDGVRWARVEPRVFSSYDDFMARRHQSSAT